MAKKSRGYEEALLGKKIPVLTLDNKWYKLFPNLNDYPEIMKRARNLNDLLKRQGKMNTETKEIKSLKKKLMQECDKLSKMQGTSVDASIIRSYLDTVLELPWNIYTDDLVELEKIRNTLDKNHYGMSKVKKRIIEQLAVKKMNPTAKGQILCLVGPPGVGKTHLLYSIANRISQLKPDIRIVCIKADLFTSELIQAIAAGTTAAFREKYRTADILLVDDIQFIAGKESTQEEFFHTFNKLYEEHKQIVMTSDRKPSDMLTLEDRLKSRFEWGLIADIQPPDYETRMAILKNKARQLGLDLSDDVCNYIAINVTNNVRQIEGTVKKILAYRDLNDMPLDLPNVSRAIDDMFKAEGNAVPTPALIIDQVCKLYGVEVSVLRGTQKSKGIAEARQICMYLIRKLTNLSLPDIGKEFGKDHSTVLYNIRKVEMQLKKGDTNLQNNIRDITANVNSCL